MQPFTILLAVIVLSHLTPVGWGRSNTGRMWRYSGDGLGFNQQPGGQRSGNSAGFVNCTYDAQPSMTPYNNWPAGFTKGGDAFTGGTFDGRYLWLAPHNALRIIRLDTFTGNMTDYWPSGLTKTGGGGYFFGALFDGSRVWLVPFSADRIVRIDASSGNLTGYKNWPAGFVVSGVEFTGAAFDGASLWFAPRSANQLIRLDPSTGNMTGYTNWPTGYLKDAAAFGGVVSDGSTIWLVPYSADRVVRLDRSTGNMTSYQSWPAGFTKGPEAFLGGVYDGAFVWLVPFSADQVVRIDPRTGNMTGYSRWPLGFPKGAQAFAGGVFDGASIWLVPYAADRLIRIDPATGNMTGYNNWPSGFSRGPWAFAGGVFDGSSIWLIPYYADAALRIGLNCSRGRTLTSTPTRSRSMSGSSSISGTLTKRRSSETHRTLSISPSPSSTLIRARTDHNHHILHNTASPTSTAQTWTATSELLSQSPTRTRTSIRGGRAGHNSSHATTTPSQTRLNYAKNRPLPMDPLTELLGGSRAGKAVATTGLAGAVASSIVSSPTAAGRASRVGAAARVVSCAFVESDAEPGYLDLPIQTEIGEGEFAAYAGSTFASSLALVALPFLALLLVAVVGRHSSDPIRDALTKLQELVVANLTFMALGYLGPNVMYSLVMVYFPRR